MERRSEMKNGIPRWDYLKCMPLYADINDIVANYTTLPPTTTTIAKVPVETRNPLLATIIGGSLGGFVFLCIVIICCLCISKRSEHKRRAEIEEQYKVVATTLTNITDSEDGCPYESLSMIDPTYRGEVELPTRKHRQRVDGVSNGLAIFKRWISVDGDSGSDGSMMPEYKRSQPLPAIPEPKGSRELAMEIDEYTEIGSENLRLKPTYFPLNENGESLSPDPNGNPYDRLRQSTLMSNFESEKPNENMNKDDYFILEKPKRSITTDDSMEPSGPYFVLESTSKKNDPTKSDPNASEQVKYCEPVERNKNSERASGNDNITDSNDNRILDNSEGNKSIEHSTSVTDAEKLDSDPYFVLEKKSEPIQENGPGCLQDKPMYDEPSENTNRPDSYIEPIAKCNTYIQIVAGDKRN